MRGLRHETVAFSGTLALALALGVAGSAPAQEASDDAILFSSTTAPNVLILLDTSGSMGESVYHPSFDSSLTTCSYFGAEQYFSATQTNYDITDWLGNPPSGCVGSRTIPVDAANTQAVEFSASYLNWYFSPAADAYAAEIASGSVDLFCIGEQYLSYGRSRITAGKHVLREVICQVAASADVRFGLARFRSKQGGYLLVENAPWSTTHEQALDTAIGALTADGWTPLAESLFQLYTYFMSRDTAQTAAGASSGSFPIYDYDLAGNTDVSVPTADPVLNGCQRHFVLIITDGQPVEDAFETGFDSNAQSGWSSIGSLVGDFEGSADDSLAINSYLNDVAKMMHTVDFRPDLTDTQIVDVYTVGFTTGGDANELLQRTALVGGGEFFGSDDPTSLTQALAKALNAIVAKSQAFTAATVPASRTTDGNNIYLSFFQPQRANAFWPGHLVNFEFTAAGEIHDANGDCAVLDPGSPTTCASGQLDPDAVPFWDAAEVMPDPPDRDLYVSTSSASSGSQPPLFDTTNADAAALGLADGDQAAYPDSNATNAAELAAEIVGFVRGCRFDQPSCTTGRPATLGDVYHSSPVVVGPPNASVNQSHYREYARRYATRSRALYAGANDGFLHAFHAGTHQAGPPEYWDRGSGIERFGFMPWQVRQQIKELPIDDPPRDHYFVDGTAQIADVRFYGTATEAESSKTWQQWHTILVGGLRQGGRQYYALDVTNPDEQNLGTSGYPDYPSYLWEFPCEANVAACNDVRPYMGETWGEPIIARVRVSVNGDGLAHERWVAIVTGGYDRTGDPNDFLNYDSLATAGRAIYVIDVKTGEVLAEKKFDATGDPLTDPEAQMAFAIASTPTVFDLDFDGNADVIYVGDLGGNVWKWVIRDLGGDPINGGGVDDLVSQPNWTFKKFFQAPTHTDAGITYYKSFFFPPTGTLHKGKLLLGFGSGERANLQADWIPGVDGDNNRLYVMSDLDPFERRASPYDTLDESDLENVTDSASCFDSVTYRGYYVVARDGEKFVTSSSIFLGDLFAGSFIPTDNPDPCGSDGEAFLYRIDISCGEGVVDPSLAEDSTPAGKRRMKVGSGLPAPPRFSVGPPSTTTPPPSPPDCPNRVVVITSDGTVTNDCPKELSGAGVKIKSWLQRD
jgi:type IV pilus assembly protein PilY1